MDHNTIDSSACAAPSPAATPKATPRATPKAGATSRPHVTAPPTDTLASTPGAITDPLSATLLVLLAISTIALAASLRFAGARTRPRD